MYFQSFWQIRNFASQSTQNLLCKFQGTLNLGVNFSAQIMNSVSLKPVPKIPAAISNLINNDCRYNVNSSIITQAVGTDKDTVPRACVFGNITQNFAYYFVKSKLAGCVVVEYIKWRSFLRFLVYYLGAGVAASLLQILFVGNISVPMLGASGAIAGVLGAYFVYFPHHKINTFVPLGFVPLFIGIPAGIVLLYWFGLQLVGGLYIEPEASGGVAFFAHIGGFLTGVVLALATKMKNVS